MVRNNSQTIANDKKRHQNDNKIDIKRYVNEM